MAWILRALLFTIGLSFVASELTTGCVNDGDYITTTFWCPEPKKIFILESYLGCSNGDPTPRCENRSADHHVCKENRDLLTDIFRQKCNTKQLCNFNHFLQNKNNQGNLRFYVWFSCTQIYPTAKTIHPTESTATIQSNQIIIQSGNYPEDFEDMRSLNFDLNVSNGISTVSVEVKELLEESGSENICFKVENPLFRDTSCSGIAKSHNNLFLPIEGNRITFESSTGYGRVRYYIIFKAMENNLIASSEMQLTYRLGPPPPNGYNNNYPTNPTSQPQPQPALPTPTPYPTNPDPQPRIHYPPNNNQEPINDPTTSTTTTKPKDVVSMTSGTSDGLNLPGLIGGIVGGVLALIAFIILAVCLVAKKKKSDRSNTDTIDKAKSKISSSIEYYPTLDNVSQANQSKQLNVCEYYDETQPKLQRGHDNNCYYEESPAGRIIPSPPVPENTYNELDAPSTGAITYDVVDGPIYSMPNKKDNRSGPVKPYIPKGGVRVF